MAHTKITPTRKPKAQSCGNSFAFLLCPRGEVVEVARWIPPPKGRVRCPLLNLAVSATGCESGRSLGVYAAGGARGAVCEKTGPVAGIASFGSGRGANGFSNEKDRRGSGSAGGWGARRQ